jgi:hypothetical protein
MQYLQEQKEKYDEYEIQRAQATLNRELDKILQSVDLKDRIKSGENNRGRKSKNKDGNMNEKNMERFREATS